MCQQSDAAPSSPLISRCNTVHPQCQASQEYGWTGCSYWGGSCNSALSAQLIAGVLKIHDLQAPNTHTPTLLGHSLQLSKSRSCRSLHLLILMGSGCELLLMFGQLLTTAHCPQASRCLLPSTARVCTAHGMALAVHAFSPLHPFVPEGTFCSILLHHWWWLPSPSVCHRWGSTRPSCQCATGLPASKAQHMPCTGRGPHVGCCLAGNGHGRPKPLG